MLLNNKNARNLQSQNTKHEAFMMRTINIHNFDILIQVPFDSIISLLYIRYPFEWGSSVMELKESFEIFIQIEEFSEK